MADIRLGLLRPLVLTVIVVVSTLVVGSRAVPAQVAIDCADYAAPASSPSIDSSPAAGNVASFPDVGGELTVFAAASLSGAFTEIAADIQAAHPDVSITFNFAGSQALVTQLTEGAEADVFASANNSQMKAAAEAGVVTGEPETFARNQLVIIVPADNPAGITSLADLDNDGVEFVTALSDVPIGQYTRQAVCAAGQNTSDFGETFVEGFAGNIVSEEENVTAIVTKISLGEGDAGIVYQTDVTPDVADSVTIIPIEPEYNVIASYPIALVEGGSTELGAAFVDYVLGPEGQETLAEFGFLPKPE